MERKRRLPWELRVKEVRWLSGGEEVHGSTWAVRLSTMGYVVPLGTFALPCKESRSCALFLFFMLLFPASSLSLIYEAHYYCVERS